MGQSAFDSAVRPRAALPAGGRAEADERAGGRGDDERRGDRVLPPSHRSSFSQGIRAFGAAQITGPAPPESLAFVPMGFAWSVIQTTAALCPGKPLKGPNTTRA